MAQLDIVDMFTKLAQKVEKGKKLPEITREAKISDLGIDSIGMMEIVGEVEDELNITIPDEKLSQLRTVGDIERVVLEQVK
jgi:acyl carrier protein